MSVQVSSSNPLATPTGADEYRPPEVGTGGGVVAEDDEALDEAELVDNGAGRDADDVGLTVPVEVAVPWPDTEDSVHELVAATTKMTAATNNPRRMTRTPRSD